MIIPCKIQKGWQKVLWKIIEYIGHWQLTYHSTWSFMKIQLLQGKSLKTNNWASSIRGIETVRWTFLHRIRPDKDYSHQFFFIDTIIWEEKNFGE